MSHEVKLTAKFPLKWLKQLQQAGATIENMVDGMKAVHMTEEHQEGAREMFTKLLSAESSVEVDPLVYPHFGVPIVVVAGIQVEVWNILGTYQPLLREAFLPNAPAIVIQNINNHPGLGYQYQHAQIALAKVRERLQNPGIQCPFIDGSPGGGFICDLHITYANGIVVNERIRRR